MFFSVSQSLMWTTQSQNHDVMDYFNKIKREFFKLYIH